ncbi:MAG TPA: mechanosensitive ion channel protein MscS [Alphaproteobacteria bacterium]|nr:mechanosensitive ion channel protein MscS [Alphaproteobacteria bacterium]
MRPFEIISERLSVLLRQFIEHLPQLAIACIVLLVTWVLARVSSKILQSLMQRAGLRYSLIDLFEKIFAILIWLLGILIAAIVVFPSLTPASVLTGIGLGSVAIGFAFRDVFENFLAGILILFREPFRLKDFIECEGYEGFVEEITIRDTHIRQVDGQRVVLPNAMLFKEPVVVRTDNDLRRTSIICGIAYGENVDTARDVIYEAVSAVEEVNDSKDVEIFAQQFGSSSIDFEVTWWTGSTPLEIRRARDKVVAAVKSALDEAEIEIPFPYRTLTFKEPLQVGPEAKAEAT